MIKLLLVGAGGGLGSILRYAMGILSEKWVHPHTFPLGTLLVNIVGCFLIGLAGGWADHRGLLNSEARLFLVVGCLGGFTTFSSFGYETLHLFRGPGALTAFLNVALQVVVGLAAVWVGYLISAK